MTPGPDQLSPPCPQTLPGWGLGSLSPLCRSWCGLQGHLTPLWNGHLPRCPRRPPPPLPSVLLAGVSCLAAPWCSLLPLLCLSDSLPLPPGPASPAPSHGDLPGSPPHSGLGVRAFCLPSLVLPLSRTRLYIDPSWNALCGLGGPGPAPCPWVWVFFVLCDDCAVLTYFLIV